MSLVPPKWRCQHGAMCFAHCPGCPGPNVGTVSLTTSVSSEGIAADIRRIVAEVRNASGPMDGVTELVCHEDMKDEALRIAAANAGGPFGRSIAVRESKFMLPGTIMGTRPGGAGGPFQFGLPEMVFIVRPEPTGISVTFVPNGPAAA